MIAILLSPLGRAGLALAGIAVFISWFAFDQRSKGAAVAVAAIEKANTNAVKKAVSVGARSRSPTTSGVRDPNTID